MRTIVALLALMVSGCALADEGVVVRTAVESDLAHGASLIPGGDLENPVDGQFPGWAGWELGYVVDREVRHGGEISARCSNIAATEHRGMTYTVQLNQERPVPILAECWSRAEDVSGARDADYSLYLDLEYMDGTPLWGQIQSFKTGTHDWQRARVAVYPTKPIKSVSVHGIFRIHTGTAWFDDFRLWETDAQQGASMFDGVVCKAVPEPPAALPGPAISTGDGIDLQLDAKTGALAAPALGGFIVRDVSGESAFVRPTGAPKLLDGGSVRWEGEAASLGLRLEATYRNVGGAIRIDGTVRDTTGKDRAVTVYFSYPFDATGGSWHDDQRVSRKIEGSGEFHCLTSVGAGANGNASIYPLACVSTQDRAVAVGSPLDVPRLWRFGYAASFRELYAAVDLGLSPVTESFPSSADFSLVLFSCDPRWGLRSALQRYYDLFPSCFTKRNEKEGIWMPFTDISTVEGFQDFGFQFKEGNDNVPFDEANGIYSFVYVEPMSHWLSMPPEMERTNERAMAMIRERAAAGEPDSQATLSSAITDADGDWYGGITKAPWCDGALYINNPSPSVRPEQAGMLTQFDLRWRAIDSAVQHASGEQSAWRPFDKGYEGAAREGRNGSTAIRAERLGDAAQAAGAAQSILLNQKEPADLVASVWTKAENVTGEPGNSYALYIDLLYSDGSPGWGFVAPAQTGSHDWQLLEQTVTPQKPVRSVSYHLLLRPPHSGTVWFDDASLKVKGREEELLKNPGFEPGDAAVTKAVLDGNYIDSLEMGASMLNYRAEHLKSAKTPLVFDSDGAVAQLMIFNTVEFAAEVAKRMWGQGKMMFANATPISYPWAAAWLDVMGIETNWGAGGKYSPNSDSSMCYRRAICYQRPYLLLLNTVFDDFKPEWMELYFKRCTAYAIFPGMFSHDAANDVYFSRPNLYNRDRHLFLRYVPVIKALSAAGWQPLTMARSDQEKVYVERFGQSGKDVYLTLFNDSDEAKTATITLEGALAQLRGAEDVLNGGEVTIADGAKLSLTIGKEDVVVLRLR